MPDYEWLIVLACLSLAIFLLLQPTSATGDSSAERLAVLAGAQRIWGETDASLRRRAIALTRWPFTQEKPELAWWGRLWARIRRPRS
jgi:hypothetical protein